MPVRQTPALLSLRIRVSFLPVVSIESILPDETGNIIPGHKHHESNQ